MGEWVENELSFIATTNRADEILAWLESHRIGGDITMSDDGINDWEFPEWHQYSVSFTTKYAPSEFEWLDELRDAFGDDFDG